MKTRNEFLLIAATCALVAGCERKTVTPTPPPVAHAHRAANPEAIDPLTLILLPHEGDGIVDNEIRKFQEQVRRGTTPEAALDRLGWAYVAKARASFDAGYYLLAEKCAAALNARQPDSPEALLLRGHALESRHHFKEAVFPECLWFY